MAPRPRPRPLFFRSCASSRYHLDKIGRGLAYRLEHGYPDENFEGLAAVCARLATTVGGNFPRTLSLEGQGRFAIGFYYERCRRWPKRDESDTGTADTAPETSNQASLF